MYAVSFDSILIKLVANDNVLPTLLITRLQFTGIPGMVEVVEVMFDSEMLQRCYARGVIRRNVLDHMACRNILPKITVCIEKKPTPEGRTEVLNAAKGIATAMEKAQKTLHDKVKTAGLLVTPPSFNLWHNVLQLENSDLPMPKMDFAICASHMRVNCIDFAHCVSLIWITMRQFPEYWIS